MLKNACPRRNEDSTRGPNLRSYTPCLYLGKKTLDRKLEGLKWYVMMSKGTLESAHELTSTRQFRPRLEQFLLIISLVFFKLPACVIAQ